MTRFVEYSDFGDLPEYRVETVGSIVLVSPNIIRLTFVNADRLGDPLKATHHQYYDVDHWLATIPLFVQPQLTKKPLDRMIARAAAH